MATTSNSETMEPVSGVAMETATDKAITGTDNCNHLNSKSKNFRFIIQEC
jgi:hypothetical protein